MHRRTLLASAALAVTGQFSKAKADTPGVSATEIKIGNTNAHSGPASAFGAIATAEAAYFSMVNDKGGINGRKLNFISLDDAYSPPRTVEQTRRLVEQEEVAFMFQGLGTACQTAVRQYLNNRKVPQLFVQTGADKFADPEHFPWTMPYPPTYRTEAAIWGKFLLAEKPDAKVGILYQNDDFGKDYLIGLRNGLGDAYDRMVVKAASYETTDPTVDSQIVTLQSAGADTLLTAATPKWAAQTIRKIADLGWRPLHLMSVVSISVSAVINPAGPDKATGMVAVTYAKDDADAQWANDPGMTEWRAFMKQYLPTADRNDIFYSYGYGAAYTLTQVLTQCGDDLSRDNVMRQATNLRDLEVPVLLPGIRINTSATNLHPIRSLQLQRWTGSTWQRFGEVLSG